MVYAPIEIDTLNLVLSGCNPDYGTIQPSGFAILPDGLELSGGSVTDVASGGCLCTFAYHTLIEGNITELPPDIVTYLCNFMKCTIERIQAAMMRVGT